MCGTGRRKESHKDGIRKKRRTIATVKLTEMNSRTMLMSFSLQADVNDPDWLNPQSVGLDSVVALDPIATRLLNLGSIDAA